MNLSKIEKKLLLHLHARNGESSVVLASQSPDFALSVDSARSACESLFHLGFLTKTNLQKTRITYTQQGMSAQKNNLPEVELILLASNQDIVISSLDPSLRNFGIMWAKKKGWIQTSNGVVSLTQTAKSILQKNAYIKLPTNPMDICNFDSASISELQKRNLIQLSSSVEDTSIKLTASGSKIASTITPTELENTNEIGVIDRNLLLSGSWKNKFFTKYDVSSPPPASFLPRRHPVSRLRKHISDIFTRMGFEQMTSELVQSSFWNFDALFQPQDHPARDLADTFYLSSNSDKLTDRDLVKNVKNAHESGWKYDWNEQISSRNVLRTHTTSASAKTLYTHRESSLAQKFFMVGKVFRNEATDYKHLAEFYQVEGIVCWEHATFGHLLGLLKSFYSHLGFEQIRFRPSYFPYTEPSLEIEVFHPQKKAWLELGGAGILRPEVSLPLCNNYPVLAWGLSLERPLMLSSDTPDIRTLYRNDVDWLRNFSVL